MLALVPSGAHRGCFLATPQELNNYVRISVGLPEHTDRLLAALKALA